MKIYEITSAKKRIVNFKTSVGLMPGYSDHTPLSFEDYYDWEMRTSKDKPKPNIVSQRYGIYKSDFRSKVGESVINEKQWLINAWKWLTKPKPKPKVPVVPGTRLKNFFGAAWKMFKGLSTFAQTAIIILLPFAIQAGGMAIQLIASMISSLVASITRKGDVSEEDIAQELQSVGVPEEEIPGVAQKIKQSIDENDIVAIVNDRERDPEEGEIQSDVMGTIQHVINQPQTESLSESEIKLLKQARKLLS